MRPLIAILALALAACASPAMDPELSLHDRFVLTALTNDDGSPRDMLFRWERPISVHYIGPEEYRQNVYDHARRLGELTGKAVVIEGDFSALTVEISNRAMGTDCTFDVHTTEPGRIHIWSGLPPGYVRECVIQELSQILGLVGDLDGLLGSRPDTVFASHQTASALTEADKALIRILYDRRLHHGMPRDQVLAVLPAIVADFEDGQAAGR